MGYEKGLQVAGSCVNSIQCFSLVRMVASQNLGVQYRIGRSGKNKWIKRKQGDFTERQKEKRHKSEARKRGNVLHRNDDQGQDALTFR